MTDEPADIVRDGYSLIASQYSAYRSAKPGDGLLARFASRFRGGAKILDAGCGAGVPVARYLAGAGLEVTGIDCSPAMIELARNQVPQASFLEMDMADLAFPKSHFDGIVAFYSIIHVPREMHAQIFTGFHRVLKPGGKMMICAGATEWEGVEDFLGVKMFWSHYGPQRTARIIRDAGFKIIFEERREEKGLEKKPETFVWIMAERRPR